MALTNEQLLAVTTKNTNIIVSAGAGSGKTTVLKERVLRELKEGASVKDLIILTFTNSAAAEMKERIRKIIAENHEVAGELEFLDSAYITTFDSFAQSLVRKYNYLLNIGKDFKIVDANIINLKLSSLIDDIFENLYKERHPVFLDFISKYCVKDDKKIKESILGLYAKYTNLIDKEKFTSSYVDTFFENSHIDKTFKEYEELVFKIKDEIVELLEKIDDETTDPDIVIANQNLTQNFIAASTYEELYQNPLPTLKASKCAYTETAKELKKLLSAKKKELNSYIMEDKETLINNFLSTKDYVLLIIDILSTLDKLIMEFKTEHNSYEFIDISLMAIKLVRDYESVRNDLKNNTYEIMIDEYQDTNDIQETFISYIANNNVYVVGDIKQSIYRFRNANPYIFRSKYNTYRDTDAGVKIDLNKNFRSRKEVVNFINLLFDSIMYEDIGGADYKLEHQMIFGNTTYDDFKGNPTYEPVIIKYNKEYENYTPEEIEAFIIADDIKKRLNKNELALTFEGGATLQALKYSDIAILIDKGKNFELIKKILESEGIPATIYKDINIKDEDEIYILKNLINLIIHIKDKVFDTDFKECFLSISRSYIIDLSDEEIFDIFDKNTFKDTILFQKCLKLTNIIDSLSAKDIIYQIIEEFNFYEKVITVGSVNERLTKLEYFLNNADNLTEFGMDIYSLNDYFEELLQSDDVLDMPSMISDSNSVKIMTIHKSKGLEFSYVYLPYLYSKFRSEKKSDYKLTKDYGLIMPFYNSGIGNSYLSIVENAKSHQEELSERIRLFYVALTRAKEQLILIDQEKETSDNLDLINAKSNSDLLYIAKKNIFKYQKNIDLSTININKNYNLVKNNNYATYIPKTNEIITTKKLQINNNQLENAHFSKQLQSLVDKNLKQTLDFGTYMHYVFEIYDFKNNNINELNITEKSKEKLTNFLNHQEFANIKDATIYKEHEIVFKEDSKIYHGIIDLLLKYSDHFDIIDYKLSNIASPHYLEQLKGYKKYILKKYKLPVNIYLYSIEQDILKKIVD